VLGIFLSERVADTPAEEIWHNYLKEDKKEENQKSRDAQKLGRGMRNKKTVNYNETAGKEEDSGDDEPDFELPDDESGQSSISISNEDLVEDDHSLIPKDPDPKTNKVIVPKGPKIFNKRQIKAINQQQAEITTPAIKLPSATTPTPLSLPKSISKPNSYDLTKNDSSTPSIPSTPASIKLTKTAQQNLSAVSTNISSSSLYSTNTAAAVSLRNAGKFRPAAAPYRTQMDSIPHFYIPPTTSNLNALTLPLIPSASKDRNNVFYYDFLNQVITKDKKDTELLKLLVGLKTNNKPEF